MKNSYDQTIGYSPLEHADERKMQQIIAINKEIVDEYYAPGKNALILVAGAGTGQEAVLVQREFNQKTVGIDLNIDRKNSPFISQDLLLHVQDLASLAFAGNQFSLVYSYHVLEHVAHHHAVLKEIYRVLKPGGVLFIGFPNKNRLVSYFGTSQNASFWTKVKWNLNDYKHRLQGSFENKNGAHAGFTEKEFLGEAAKVFEKVYSVRNEYMMKKYPRFHGLISWFITLGVAEIVFPSNYYVCIKEG